MRWRRSGVSRADVSSIARQEARNEFNAQFASKLGDQAQSIIKTYYAPAVLDQIRLDVLGRVANDPELLTLIRALAAGNGEHAAKAYIAHLLGAKVTVEIGSTLAGVEAALPPIKPPA